MIKILIGFLLTYSSMCLSGQYTHFKNALIIKSDSTKLIGYVERIGESSLSLKVKYKKSIEEKDFQTLSVSDIKQLIFFSDSSVFENVKYIHYKDSTKIVEHRLAKKVLNGYAELYKLQLPYEELNIIFERSVTFVYIIKIDTAYYVLEQKEKLEGPSYKLYKGYIGVLSSILKDSEKLKEKTDKVKFDDRDIIPLIDSFNAEHSGVPRETLIRNEKTYITHGPTIGYIILDNIEDFSWAGFDIGYSISIIQPEVSEKISNNIGLSIGQAFLKERNEKRYSSLYLKIPVSLAYHITNKKFAPFIDIGLSPFITPMNYVIFVNLSSGVAIYNKIVVTLKIENWGSILSLNFGYRFGSGKLNSRKPSN